MTIPEITLSAAAALIDPSAVSDLGLAVQSPGAE